ncbi:MAG: PhoH family protein [Flavobacteriales bacterium]
MKKIKSDSPAKPGRSKSNSGAPSSTKKVRKIYVLDTSVLLHDHNSINSFEEHDVAIPITVLEELDKFKVGNDIKNFEARECIRIIDRLSEGHSLQVWIPLEHGNGGRLRIILNGNEGLTQNAEAIFDTRKNDHKILNAALQLQVEEGNALVTMVTKDINLRLKSKALDLPAEDYKTGKVKEGTMMYSGKSTLSDLDSEVIRKLYQDGRSNEVDILGKEKHNNHFYILKNCSSSALAYYSARRDELERVDKVYAYGIKPKNAEQAFALHAILNPEIRLVTISGVAGTGKTLLALAGSLEMKNHYDQLFLARPIVPLSNKEIGYLPGDAEEKINPYMQPLWDNLNYIKNQFGENEKKRKAIDEMQSQGKITICPLAFIRGRSLSNCVMIVDEAQNLTPHEVKTIITRAGENTKIVLTGDVRQIDTPYLDEQSNGMSYVIERLKGQDLYCHITLERGERSELANLANEML